MLELTGTEGMTSLPFVNMAAAFSGCKFEIFGINTPHKQLIAILLTRKCSLLFLTSKYVLMTLHYNSVPFPFNVQVNCYV